MVAFNDVRLYMAEKGCTMLTTEEEYAHLNKRNFKVRYTATCGHEHEVHYNVFKHRGSGILCPKCVSKCSAENRKGDASRTSEGQSSGHELEDKCIAYLTDMLSSGWVLRRTVEGCHADIAVKPVDCHEDTWLGVQVKSTARRMGAYGFHMKLQYPECVVILMAWEDKKIWMLKGKDTTSTKISIGLTKSKYSKYQCRTLADMHAVLLNCLKELPLKPLNVMNKPTSVRQQKEQEFRYHREHICKSIVFGYPEHTGLHFDFTVQGKKIQEKVGTYVKQCGSIVFVLQKGNGCRLKRAYDEGDNDFYWLNFPDKQYFYVIPEQELISAGFVAEGDKPTKTTFYIPMGKGKTIKDAPFQDYLFDYTELNDSRLVTLLGVV